MAAKDVTSIGSKFHRLTVIGEPYRGKFGHWTVRCRCDCGNEATPVCQQLVTGQSKSCGCLIREYALANVAKLKTHGMTKTRTYRIWRGMVNRCFLTTETGYANYGGRGITVCDRWRKFENFYADMGDAPSHLSIDRIDVNGDYEPNNCRWATDIEQCNNKTNNVFLVRDGRRQTLAQWASEFGLPKNLPSKRRAAGWPPERWLEPSRTTRKRSSQ